MTFIKEFKEFALRGNVVDLAIAVIIGGAFGRIVTSMVNDIIMPPIGLALGGVDFKDLMVVLREAYIDPAGESISAVTLNYGNFIQQVVDFLIIAFIIFMIIRSMARLQKKEEAKPTPPPAPSREEKLLEEIRDLLKRS
ncbi:large-conductance mechanosensitive channel protein MscL [Litoribacter alkaliphilus]|uniref:Large-conductance mechanosensitive channel n=1 Tax=Litoribacter ruber TaxID=702568 RepID=A0AAP2CHJ1_9BACT|nr:large-conductance mechanosensitive channel protein MscL [Litoribacter alkaliphilus]MBS9524821.1 large-conductance mechanosensitive channel protein MscL [Litoribacter alkaliphilus]